MNEQDIKRAAEQAGKAFGDASKAANNEVQGWAGAVPVIKWALVGVAGLIALVFIAYAVG